MPSRPPCTPVLATTRPCFQKGYLGLRWREWLTGDFLGNYFINHNDYEIEPITNFAAGVRRLSAFADAVAPDRPVQAGIASQEADGFALSRVTLMTPDRVLELQATDQWRLLPVAAYSETLDNG